MEDKQLPWQEGRDAHPEAPRHRGSFCVCKGTSQLLTCKNCRWLGAIWLSHIITDVSRGVTRRTEAFHTQRSHLGRRQNTKAEAAMAWLEKNCYSQCSNGPKPAPAWPGSSSSAHGREGWQGAFPPSRCPDQGNCQILSCPCTQSLLGSRSQQRILNKADGAWKKPQIEME